MNVMRKVRAGRGLQMDTVAVPLIGPTDVLVRVKTASICGTDLHIYGWDRWSQGRIKPPVTLGHEFCGTVERVGDEVRAVKPGDFVSAEMHVNCGHRSEEHTSELQSQSNLVCRLLLEKKKNLNRRTREHFADLYCLSD